MKYLLLLLPFTFIFFISCGEDKKESDATPPAYAMNIEVEHTGPNVYRLNFNAENTDTAEKFSQILADKTIEEILKSLESYSLSIEDVSIVSVTFSKDERSARIELSKDIPIDKKTTLTIKEFKYTDSEGNENIFKLSTEIKSSYAGGETYTLDLRANIFVGNLSEDEAQLPSAELTAAQEADPLHPKLTGTYPVKIPVPENTKWVTFKIIGHGSYDENYVFPFYPPSGGRNTAVSREDKNGIIYADFLRYESNPDDGNPNEVYGYWFASGIFIDPESYDNTKNGDSITGGRTTFKTNVDPDTDNPKTYWTTLEDFTETALQKAFYIGTGRRIKDEYEGLNKVLFKDHIKNQLFDSDTDSLRYFKVPEGAKVLLFGIQDHPAQYFNNGEVEIEVGIEFFSDGYDPEPQSSETP